MTDIIYFEEQGQSILGALKSSVDTPGQPVFRTDLQKFSSNGQNFRLQKKPALILAHNSGKLVTRSQYLRNWR